MIAVGIGVSKQVLDLGVHQSQGKRKIYGGRA